jgi:DNA-directed RNA polymerase subunit beta-beta'
MLEDGTIVEDENGDLNGYSSFIKVLDKFRFSNPGIEDTQRSKVIDMMYNNIKNGTFLMNKLLVISPDFRPVTIPMEPGERPMVDEMNDLYNRVIILSNQLKSVSGSLFDILSYKMQLLLAEIHAYTKAKISKKTGMIRNLMLGRRVDLSARSVIAPNPNLKLGEVGVPLRLVCSLFEPTLIYGLVNAPEAASIPEEFHKEVKAYLGKELDPDLLSS